MMTGIAELPVPRGALSAGKMHAGQPAAADELGRGRIGHVDHDHDGVDKALEQGRCIGPAAARVPDAMHADAVDRHEADLARIGPVGDVEDADAGAVSARLLGLFRHRAGVVDGFVRQVRVGVEVHAIDDEQQVLVRLQMNAPGAGRALHIVDGLGIARVADVEDRKTVRELVADVGVAVLNHDLDAVASATLIGISDQSHVLGVVGLRQVVGAHGAFLCFRRQDLSEWRRSTWTADCTGLSEAAGRLGIGRTLDEGMSAREVLINFDADAGFFQRRHVPVRADLIGRAKRDGPERDSARKYRLRNSRHCRSRRAHGSLPPC